MERQRRSCGRGPGRSHLWTHDRNTRRSRRTGLYQPLSDSDERHEPEWRNSQLQMLSHFFEKSPGARLQNLYQADGHSSSIARNSSKKTNELQEAKENNPA